MGESTVLVFSDVGFYLTFDVSIFILLEDLFLLTYLEDGFFNEFGFASSSMPKVVFFLAIANVLFLRIDASNLLLIFLLISFFRYYYTYSSAMFLAIFAALAESFLSSIKS